MLILAMLVSSLPFAPAGASLAARGFTTATSRVTVTHYGSGTANHDLRGITLGSDGAVWYTDTLGALLLRMTTLGQVTSYPLKATLGTQLVKFKPGAIASGADGLLYIGGDELRMRTLGVFSPSAGLRVLALPDSDGPGEDGQVVLGPNGLIWYSGRSHIGSVSPSGVIKTYRVPMGYGPLVQGPDGNLWFATKSRTPVVGSLNPSTGKIHTYPLPVPGTLGCTAIIPWNASLIAQCLSGDFYLDLVSTSGGQTQLLGLKYEQLSIQTLLAPSGSLPLVAVGETLAAADFTHANFVHALLPSMTFPGATIIGSDARIWSLDNTYGNIDALTLNGPLSSSTQATWQQFSLGGGAGQDVSAGSDGAMWVSDPSTASLVRIDANGNIMSFKLKVDVSGKKYRFDPYSFAAGADGNFYVSGHFAKNYDNIVVVTTGGVVTNLYSVPNGPGEGGTLTPGTDGNVWFTGFGAVGYITTNGTVKEFALQNQQGGPIVAGTDGSMWFIARTASSYQLDAIVPATGKITTFNLPCTFPTALAAVPGQVYVACPQASGQAYDLIVAVTPSGSETLYPGVSGYDATTAPDGTAFFSLAEGGLGTLQPAVGEFVQFPSPYLSNITRAATDSAGNVWAIDAESIDELSLH